MSVFLATQNFLETIAIKDIKRFQKEILEYIELKYNDILLNIREKKELTDEIANRLKEAAEDFLSKFKNS